MPEYYSYINDLGREKALIVEKSENEICIGVFDRATGDFCGGTTIEEQSLQEYINHYNAIKISDLDAYMRGALPYQDDFDSATTFEEYYRKCAKTIIAENMKMNKSISEEGYRHFQTAIEALEQHDKAIETSEQKKGKWIPIPYDLDYESDAKCSLCQKSFIGAIDYNYCPNCGAKMIKS